MLRLFSDGGVLWDGLGVGSRSTIGGSYAFILVEEDDRVVCEKSGVIEASVLGHTEGAHLPTVTNNTSELYALAYGVMHVPVGSDVHVYSDSQCALGRMFKQHTLNGVPKWLCSLTCNARDRILNELGRTPYTLLAGHPTKAELVTGIGKGGLPVDKFNKWCDAEASKAGKRWLEENKVVE